LANYKVFVTSKGKDLEVVLVQFSPVYWISETKDSLIFISIKLDKNLDFSYSINFISNITIDYFRRGRLINCIIGTEIELESCYYNKYE